MLSTPLPREYRYEVDKKCHDRIEEAQEGEHELWLVVHKDIRLKIPGVEADQDILRQEVQDEYSEN